MLQSMGLQRVRNDWVTEQQNVSTAPKIYVLGTYAFFSLSLSFQPKTLVTINLLKKYLFIYLICEITNLVKEVTVGRIMVMMMIKDKLNWILAICFSSVQSLSCVFKVGSPCSPRNSQESSLTSQFKRINYFFFSIEV